MSAPNKSYDPVAVSALSAEEVQRAVMHQPFDRIFVAGDEPFDENRLVRRVAFGANFGRPQQRAQSLHRCVERRWIVCAHHAAAARERNRLDDAGKGRDVGGGVGRRTRKKPRHEKPGGAKAFARQLLVTSGHGCFRRVPRQPQRLRDARGDHRGPVANGHDAIERLRLRDVDNRRDRCVLVVESDRDRLVLPRILDEMTPIGRVDKLHAEALGRLAKRPCLVACRCG